MYEWKNVITLISPICCLWLWSYFCGGNDPNFSYLLSTSSQWARRSLPIWIVIGSPVGARFPSCRPRLSSDTLRHFERRGAPTFGGHDERRVGHGSATGLFRDYSFIHYSIMISILFFRYLIGCRIAQTNDDVTHLYNFFSECDDQRWPHTSMLPQSYQQWD